MNGYRVVEFFADGLHRQLEASGRWMAWNLVLALTPWVLAVVLFRGTRRPGWPWFAGLAAWLLLIPNAAYVLADVVHLPAAVRREPSDTLVVVAVLPLYLGFFAVGFVAYADALRRLRAHVRRQGWVRRGWPVEIAVHAASAVGIYLGRVQRLNSWAVVTQPATLVRSALAGFTRPLAVAGIVVVFAGLSVGQAMARFVLDGIAAAVPPSCSGEGGRAAQRP